MGRGRPWAKEVDDPAPRQPRLRAVLPWRAAIASPAARPASPCPARHRRAIIHPTPGVFGEIPRFQPCHSSALLPSARRVPALGHRRKHLGEGSRSRTGRRSLLATHQSLPHSTRMTPDSFSTRQHHRLDEGQADAPSRPPQRPAARRWRRFRSVRPLCRAARRSIHHVPGRSIGPVILIFAGSRQRLLRRSHQHSPTTPRLGFDQPLHPGAPPRRHRAVSAL